MYCICLPYRKLSILSKHFLANRADSKEKKQLRHYGVKKQEIVVDENRGYLRSLCNLFLFRLTKKQNLGCWKEYKELHKTGFFCRAENIHNSKGKTRRRKRYKKKCRNIYFETVESSVLTLKLPEKKPNSRHEVFHFLRTGRVRGQPG